jgi:hypothetical protein
LKRLLAIVILVAMLLPTLNRVWILVDFAIHQDYIASVLCIKKDAPLNLCHGSCVLSDQLQQVEEEEERVPAPPEVMSEVVFFENPDNLHLLFLSATSKQVEFAEPANYRSSSFLDDVFRPPIFIS